MHVALIEINKNSSAPPAQLYQITALHTPEHFIAKVVLFFFSQLRSQVEQNVSGVFGSIDNGSERVRCQVAPAFLLTI